MTDYSSRVRKSKSKLGVPGGTTLAILLVGVVLSIVAIRGILSTKKAEEVIAARWDGVSSFVFAIDGSRDYLAILQKDPKRAVLFVLGDVVPEGASPAELMKTVSAESGVVVSNYLVGDGGEDAMENFEQFKSYVTPVKIVLGGWDRTHNNISRYDALRLWWQTKNVRVEEVTQVEIDRSAGLDSGNPTLGANTQDINRLVTPYVENLAILNDDLEINVVNSSGDVRVPVLVDTFVTSVGGRIATVAGSTNLVDRCLVQGRESYTRDYLAKTFDCDIKDEVLGESSNIITLVVGRDFAKTYL